MDQIWIWNPMFDTPLKAQSQLTNAHPFDIKNNSKQKEINYSFIFPFHYLSIQDGIMWND